MNAKRFLVVLSLIVPLCLTVESVAQRRPVKGAARTAAAKKTVRTGAKTVAKKAATVTGKRITFEGYSIVMPEGTIYSGEKDGGREYTGPDGKLKAFFLPQKGGFGLTLEECAKMDKDFPQAAKENNMTLDQAYKAVAKNMGFTTKRKLSSMRMIIEDGLFYAMSSMMVKAGYCYGSEWTETKVETHADYTLMYASSVPSATSLGILIDWKNGNALFCVMIEPNVDNRPRLATLRRASNVEAAPAKIDSAAVKKLNEKFVENVKDNHQQLKAEVKTEARDINVTVLHKQYKEGVYGMRVKYSFNMVNSPNKDLSNLVGVRVIVLKKVQGADPEYLYDDATYITPANSNDTDHYSGTFFIPYRKVKYVQGLNEFVIHFAVPDNEDDKEWGFKDVETSLILN